MDSHKSTVSSLVHQAAVSRMVLRKVEKRPPNEHSKETKIRKCYIYIYRKVLSLVSFQLQKFCKSLVSVESDWHMQVNYSQPPQKASFFNFYASQSKYEARARKRT